MMKTKYSKLSEARDKRKVDIAFMLGTIQANLAKIKQATEDKQVALRAKNQTAAHDSQFQIDTLQLENADMQKQIETLKAARPTQEETDAAWKDDLIESPEYLAEMAMLQTASALYNAVCVRAQREESEWESLAFSLDMLRNGGNIIGRKYWAPSPAKKLEVSGYGRASATLFHDPNGQSITFDPAGIDKLIEILQSIKSNGIDSIL
jgi:hypothetical protein